MRYVIRTQQEGVLVSNLSKSLAEAQQSATERNERAVALGITARYVASEEEE